MARRRNPYRPGTESYARRRKAELRRQAALARATAKRTKTKEKRRRAKRQAAAAERALKGIVARQEYRSRLNEHDRDGFNRCSLGRQDQLLKMLRDFPDSSVPSDLPDPFVGKNRSMLWRLYYSTRAGSRQRAAA